MDWSEGGCIECMVPGQSYVDLDASLVLVIVWLDSFLVNILNKSLIRGLFRHFSVRQLYVLFSQWLYPIIRYWIEHPKATTAKGHFSCMKTIAVTLTCSKGGRRSLMRVFRACAETHYPQLFYISHSFSKVMPLPETLRNIFICSKVKMPKCMYVTFEPSIILLQVMLWTFGICWT